MTDTIATPTRLTSARTETVAHLIGALAVGCVVASAISALVFAMPLWGTLSDGFDVIDVTPELAVPVAVGVAFVRPLRRFAWLVSAAGLLGMAGLYVQGTALEMNQLLPLLAICVGLQLGGALLALAQASPEARWAIAIGLGGGMVAGRLTSRLIITNLLSGEHRDEVVVTAFGVIAVAAGIILLRRRPPERSEVDRPDWGPVVAIAIAIMAAVGLTMVWQVVLDGIARSSIGGISESQAASVEATDTLVRIMIGVTVGLVLTVAAYRRGGPNLARWVAVASGLAVTSATIPAQYSSDADLVGPALVPAVLGAAAGAALVRWADRRFPWDALGVALAAVAAFVNTYRGPLEMTGLVESSKIFGWFGLGLGLVAGLARLAVPAPDGSPGRGLSVGDVSLSAGLGVAAFVLWQRVVSPLAFEAEPQDSGVPSALPLVMLAASVVIAGLFGLARFRTNVPAEATAIPS